MTCSSTSDPPCSLASLRAIAVAWLAEAEKSCGTRILFQPMPRAWIISAPAALASDRHFEHALDRPQCADAHRLRNIDLRLEIAQRQVQLLERVAPHVRAQVARAALVLG